MDPIYESSKSQTNVAIVSLAERCPISQQSQQEEWINTLTHGFGLLLSIAGLTVLAVHRSLYGSAWSIVCCCVFGVTMVLTYAASTFYHSQSSVEGKRLFQVIDHSCIYLLIAGTCTPFALLVLKGAWGWSLFGFVWGMALLGIVFKILIKERHERMEAILYLLMGWSVVVAIVPLKQNLPLDSFILLFAGGMAYSIGVLFYLGDRIPYNHGIWHLFVLMGSGCHFFAIYCALTPGM